MTHPSSATPVDITELRVIRSHAFGEVAVPPSAIMHFASPLWGFPERHDYALLPAARAGLYWLQAADDDVTTFILADPFVLDQGYSFDLSDTDKQAVRATQPDDILGLVMLTLPQSPDASATANFRAPLVFNLRERLAVQIVTSDDRHSLRAPADLAQFPAQADGVRLL